MTEERAIIVGARLMARLSFPEPVVALKPCPPLPDIFRTVEEIPRKAVHRIVIRGAWA